MKRLVLLAAAAIACSVAVVPAGAGARAPSVAPTPATAVTTAASPARATPVKLRWLRNNLIGFHVGPSRATGYGKGRLTGFKPGCPECRWFRATNRMTDHPPVDPASADAAVPAALMQRGGFCWPWDNFPWSGDSCWNDMATWNWGSILDSFNYHPVWDPMSTVDRIVGCYQGAYQGFTGGVIGKQAVGILIEMSDLVKVTPAGIAWSILGGCAFHLFHR
jgi:hypothetical protein